MTAATITPAAEVRRLRAELADLSRLADALADAIDHEAEVGYRRRLCAEAYQRGQEDAYARGYVAAVEDVKRTEHGLVDAMRLAGRRLRPAGAAWLAAVERHGGTEFGGHGLPRVPVPAEVIERAREMAR